MQAELNGDEQPNILLFIYLFSHYHLFNFALYITQLKPLQHCLLIAWCDEVEKSPTSGQVRREVNHRKKSQMICIFIYKRS